jgi:hypothetical protein
LVILCKNCHLKYESHADAYKDTLAREYDIPLEGHGWVLTPENSIVRKAASAVIKHRDGKLPLIPVDRIQHLQKIVDTWKTEQALNVSTDDILNCALQLTDRYKGADFIDHGEYVVKSLMRYTKETPDNGMRWPDLEDFVKSWRRHFLIYCNCEYLSEKWSIDADIYVQ